MPKLVNQVFRVLGVLSNSESNLENSKEIGKVCLYVVLFSRIINFKESGYQDCQGNCQKMYLL